MKKTLVLVLVLIMALTACLAIACKPEKKPDPPTPTPSTATIKSVIADGKNNVKATVSGVVFAKSAEGYFIYDEVGMYVLGTTTAAIGDQVEVAGTVMKSGSRFFIKNATVTTKATAQTLPTATAMELSALAVLATDSANYAKLVTVTGIVEKAANGYKLVEGKSSVYLDASSTNAVKEFEGKKVTCQVVTYDHKTDGWTVVVASDITAAKVDIDEVKAFIFAKSAPETEVYGVLELVTSDANNPSVVFEWSVVSGEGVTIANNVATISEAITADAAVVLQLKITAEGKSATQTYPITVKPVKTVALKDLATATIEAGAKIRTEGLVIACGTDNYDPVNVYTIIADVESKTIVAVVGSVGDVKVGDKISVVSEYADSDWGSVNTKVLTNVIGSKVVSGGNTVDFEALAPTTLETAEQYSAFYNKGNLNLIKLVKVVDPYLIYSGNTTYNFLRFGASADTAKNGVATSADQTNLKNNVFCMKLSNFNAENGLANWESSLNVPLLNDGAVQYSGLTFYAVSLLGIKGNNESWQFLIPNVQAITMDLVAGAEKAIKAAIPAEISAAEAGKIALPTTLPLVGTITWASDKADKLDAQGNYTAVTEDTEVKLTATFTVSGATHTVEVVVKLVNKVKKISTVTEVAALEAGTEVDSMRGVVIGITPGHSGSGDALGLVVSDGTTVVTLSGNGNMTVNKYVISIGETPVKIGDIVVIDKVTANGSVVTLSSTSVVTVEGKQPDLSSTWFKAEAATVIDSEEDLVALAATLSNSSSQGRDYKLVKLVGTSEAPLSIGARNSSYYINFYYNQPEYMNSGNTKVYPGWHSNSIVWGMGAEWAIENTPITEVGTGTYGTKADKSDVHRFIGEVYAIFEYTGSATYPFAYFSFIGAGLNLTPLSAQATAKAELDAAMAEIDGASFSGYEAGTVTLPQSVGEYEITWTANLPAVFDVATGAYTKVTEDTTIELTAKITVDGQEVTATYSILLTAAKPVTAVSLKQALETAAAAEGHTTTVECIEAVVAAHGSSNNGVANGARGLVLTDGTFTAWMDGNDGDIVTVAGVEVKSGDKVRIENATVTYEEGVKSVISGELKAIVSSDNAIDYTNLKVVTVSNEEEMVAWAATGLHQGIAVKFTGNFFMIGTSKSQKEGNRLQLNYKGSSVKKSADARYDFAGEEKPSKTVALHLQGNARLLGAEWYAPLGIVFDKETGTGSGHNFACTGTIVAVAGAYGNTIAGFTVIDKASFSLALAA